MASIVPNYNRPIFAASPILVSMGSSVGSISGYNSSISEVEEVYTCNQQNGSIIEKVTVTLGTAMGNTNSEMVIYICVYSSTIGGWFLYKSMAVPAVTVSNTEPAPSAEFIFDGGLLLKENDKVGVARSANSSGDDNLHIILEGGGFDVSI